MTKKEDKPKPARRDTFGSSIPQTLSEKEIGRVRVPPQGRNGPPLPGRPDRNVI